MTRTDDRFVALADRVRLARTSQAALLISVHADALAHRDTKGHGATVYTLVLFAYIITSWLRLPYSPWLNRIQRFLYDVSEPYLRLFRRILPSMGGLDLSPWVATIVLWVIAYALIGILGKFH